MNETEGLAIMTTGLVKRYGSRVAVDGIDLRIPRGSLFSLLGPNGAGKTTTIRMLCGLARPSAGSMTVMGLDAAADAAAIRYLVGVSPQETAIAARLTVRENLEMMGGIYGLPKRRTRERADELLEALGLGDRAGDRASTLSGGTQRRVSVGMALMPDPPLLFLDEPTVGLDPSARRGLWRLIASLKGTTTILLTTHYLEEADALADDVAIIDKGRIIASGSPVELKSRVAAMRSAAASGSGPADGTATTLDDVFFKFTEEEAQS